MPAHRHRSYRARCRDAGQRAVFPFELLANMGRHVDARDWIRKALELARSEGLSELLFGIELWSNVLLVDDDRPEEAIAFLKQALEQHKGSGSHAEAGILFNLSFAYLHTSRFRQGADAAMHAREIFLALDMEYEADSCIINLCACLLEVDNSTKPVKYLRDLLDRARAKSLPRVEAGALKLLAKAGRRSNKPEEAVEFSRRGHSNLAAAWFCRESSTESRQPWECLQGFRGTRRGRASLS